MKRISFFLDDKLLKRLRRTATRNGDSIASIVREAVSRCLAGPEQSAKLPSIAGRFASGTRDTADNTDKFLWREVSDDFDEPLPAVDVALDHDRFLAEQEVASWRKPPTRKRGV